ncbi:flagellar assembly protein FliH [Peribacillus deserti]|uniref:Flagellar assembly protein FliH n=1 Tax=Peribacillus deserti TaxID=673318 RepID=A0ABS2QGI2_9BACI|nr:flagellar assembly protein FliH [Peribacillus deserti]
MSRIIKSSNSVKEKENKLIRIKSFDISQDSFTVHPEPSAANEQESYIEEAKNQADEIISLAHARADQMFNEIMNQKQQWENEELPLLTERASQEGFSQGYEAGREQGYSEMAASIASARNVIESARIDYKERIESSEKTILDLSIRVAEKIIGKKLADSEEYFLSLVKRAIKEAREYKEVQLHIHPSHYGFILSEKEKLTALFPKNTELYIYPDEELEETSCIIESSNGRIDASVDSQLYEIKEKLLGLLEGE